MNILFFGKKRHGKGSHEYQRHVVRNMPISNQIECYGRKLMMDNHTYIFDRFDDMGNAIFVDDQWDDGDNDMINAIGREETLIALGIDRMADDGCPCHYKTY
jgi:hypothetical protein